MMNTQDNLLKDEADMCSFCEDDMENMCSNKEYDTCGDYNRTTSYKFVKILEFTHFCSFFNFGRTDVKRNKKQIVNKIHVVVGYRVDTRDTIFFDE
jgi:hypothetical protein